MNGTALFPNKEMTAAMSAVRSAPKQVAGSSEEGARELGLHYRVLWDLQVPRSCGVHAVYQPGVASSSNGIQRTREFPLLACKAVGA